MKANITRCARCGENHKDLEFTELTHSQNEWTHWAVCPHNSEPIMLSVTDSGPAGCVGSFNEDAVDFLRTWRAGVGYIIIAPLEADGQDDNGLSLLYVEGGLDKATPAQVRSIKKSLDGLQGMVAGALTADV